MKISQYIREQLSFLYGEQSDQIWMQIEQIVSDFQSQHPEFSIGKFNLTEKDVVLITYGDQFQSFDQNPLKSLKYFLDNHLGEAVNWIHLLPFYPYSSDDGFSVIDYRLVDPQLGNWSDISQLSETYSLMFDAVINHISRESDWFRRYQKGDPPFSDYFIEVDPETDISSVFRPRALPLITPVDTIAGQKFLWTTFSEDQIDLNFSNPQLLVEIIKLFLFYIEKGARLIRLDAVGYTWKAFGTSCLNLPEAHSIVKIFRGIVNLAAPNTGLITETNVPHSENIKYFGDPFITDNNQGEAPSGDEAQMVYQFSLAPLVLHTFHAQDATALSHWIDTLSVPYHDTAFFNFIASHDGIGVMPAKGLLTEEQIQSLIEKTLLHGGEVSYKTNSDGTKSVYELNITLYDALNDPADESPGLDAKRFLASQVLMLSLAGVPGIYVHSLFGSRNCHTCATKTGRARSINREKFDLQDLNTLLEDQDNIHTQIFNEYKQLLSIRQNQPAFHPAADQRVYIQDKNVFMLLRTSQDLSTKVFCLVNVTNQTQKVDLELSNFGLENFEVCIELIANTRIELQENILSTKLSAYQSQWLLLT